MPNQLLGEHLAGYPFISMNNTSGSAVQFCLAGDVAAAMKISMRQFYRLKKRWQHERLIKEGRHFIRPGRRAIRYDLEAILDVARRQGYA